MNNKRSNLFFIIFCFAFISTQTVAQNSSDWVSHISYWADITQLAQSGEKVYAVTDGKLFIYNNTDGSLEEYIKYKGGNTDITHIVYNKKHKCLFITRSDANIELLYEDKSYIEISNIKNYTGQNIDKTINHIFMTDDLAYLSTNYGFSIIDLKERVVKESGLFYSKFYSINLLNNNLYAATEAGILTANIDTNLQDYANWKKFPIDIYYKDADYKFEDSNIKNVITFKDKLYFLFPDSAVYRMETPESVVGILKGSKPFAMYNTDNEHLFIINKQRLWDYSDLDNFNNINIERLNYIIPNGNKTNEYWTSSVGNHLSLVNAQNGNLEYLKQYIRPQGPASNFPFTQTYGNNQLLISGGGFDSNRQNRPASISIYKNSQWTNIYEYQITGESGIYAKDLVYAISDPRNPSHIFASSWGEGLYEFEDNHFKMIHDKDNSTIEVINGENGWYTTRVSGMAYDKNNNLWLLNSMVPHAIKIYTSNNEWKELFYPELNSVDTNIKNILIDRYSKKWITSVGTSSTGLDAYIFILNDKNTPFDSSDDEYKFVQGNNFTNDLDQKFQVQAINSITEDNNGHMWVGTDVGPFRIPNSSSSSFDVKLNRIMVEKDGDAGTITPLLENIVITSIAIDGAGRKWIGTQTAGVYLISSDYQRPEILEHFTLEDSPLPSNNILSISIDSKGVVYIGTERGLMAYNARVTAGSDDFSNVYVYPNPVRPDYNGLITVTGLKSNSRVKITDVKGNLIIEGTSLGGQFVWDGFNSRKRRVDTGIYLVFGSSEDGSEGVVTKIMIVNE